MIQHRERYGDFEIYSDPTAPKYSPAGEMTGWTVGLFVKRIGDAKPMMRLVHYLGSKHQAEAVTRAKKWCDENPKARLKDSRALTLQELVFETAVAFDQVLGTKTAKKTEPLPEPEEEEPSDPLKGQKAFKRNLENFEKGGKGKTAKSAPGAPKSLPDDEEDF